MPHLCHCIISFPLVMFYYISDLGHVIGMYCLILKDNLHHIMCFFHQPANQCVVSENIHPHPKEV